MRYFGDNYLQIATPTEDKLPHSKGFPGDSCDGGEPRLLKRAGVTLFDMQCQLNACGATDLVIDIIMQKPSYYVFVECIKLAISLLEGGNSSIQVNL